MFRAAAACPGCGLTRSWVALMHGNLADSIREHPLGPITVVVALQLFAYHVARIRGCPIDQPKNLAKSVTVE